MQQSHSFQSRNPFQFCNAFRCPEKFCNWESNGSKFKFCSKIDFDLEFANRISDEIMNYKGSRKLFSKSNVSLIVEKLKMFIFKYASILFTQVYWEYKLLSKHHITVAKGTRNTLKKNIFNNIQATKTPIRFHWLPFQSIDPNLRSFLV